VLKSTVGVVAFVVFANSACCLAFFSQSVSVFGASIDVGATVGA
jgi:hypothetical protein